MRNFRHLNRDEIHEIIAAHAAGERQADIATRFNVDHSTVHYHISKYERSYPEEGGVYAVIKAKARKACLHPSGRCTLCGEMWDELRRSEWTTIETLKRQLDEATRKLRRAGLTVE